MDSKKPTAYDHAAIEKKWQEQWQKDGIYTVQDNVKGKDNFYTLVEFTYPSGNLHVGHWYAFSVPDIFARYKRMSGYNVLYPMGFDAFGLPAENAAIKLGADPKVWTYEQMEKMRAQLRSMGAMFPWDREIVSCDPAYYKWTQWMFNQFLKNDLVYRDVTKVNWCPKDQTILANEQVVDGKCERCGTEVEQRDQEQWMLRITKYADRLIDDLDKLAWPEEIKAAQRNWIGRSEGSEIFFNLNFTSHPQFNANRDKDGNPARIPVFTTRADTLFGATYLVLAPEHPWVTLALDKDHTGVIDNADDVRVYVEQSKRKSELDRQQSKEKTGVEILGVKAINPASGEEIPIWVADYVLAGYGTGAVMAVPAHDERDFEFAKKYNLPIKEVISKQWILTGKNAEREETETLHRTVVDPIIKDNEGNFYFVRESGQVHFAGGGVEDGETEIEALKREVIEETGFTDFTIEKKHVPIINLQGFRHGKNKNQRSVGTVYEVTLTSLNRIDSEVEEGKHELVCLKKDEVLGAIGWEQHKYLFEKYLNGGGAYTEEGILFSSGEFSGLTSQEAKQKITEFVDGKMVKTYRLRDWGISRQRYWGCPIPIVYDPDGNAHPVPDKHLPWMLPTDVDHTPDGTAPLARSKELFERTEKLFGKGWKPEVETMDTFVDSSWYFYRYLDNTNKKAFADKKTMDAWMPVDLYMGGAEHTTMHLLYSRFWVKALYDLGFVKDDEAYQVRRNRGLILGPDGNKMSKSKGNVIDPDEIVERLGADTVRMYLGFMGPYGVTTNYPWDPNGVVGVRRFLERVWKLALKIDREKKVCKTDVLVHKTIKGVGEDIEDFKFNTAIAKMMILLNALEKEEKIVFGSYKILLRLLAPFAPHMTEELWYELGERQSIHLSDWPIYDLEKIVDETVVIGVQINGKVRAELSVAIASTTEEIKAAALALPRIKEYLAGGMPKKVIVVPGRIINIVI